MRYPNFIKFICAVIMLCCVYDVFGQERRANIHDFNVESNNFMKSVWTNPGMLYFYPDSAYSDVSLRWDKSEAKGLYVIEKGDQQQQVDFDAQSFLRKENSIVHGRAAYHRGQTNNIKWSTVVDYDLVAPYIVADTLGGDTYSEGYVFDGGYTFKRKKLLIGIMANYRTAEDYRKLDPRPKSKTSDLNITVGGAYHISNRYIFGVHVTYNDYQQQHSIAIYKPSGSIKLFYLKGLGVSDRNSSTVITKNASESNYYEQTGANLGLQFIPFSGVGLWGSVNYNQRKMELQNSRFDPLSHLKSDKISAEIGWQGYKEKGDWKLKFSGNYLKQNGTEYNYEQRRLLSKLKKYSNDCWNGKLSWMNRHFKKSTIHFWQATVEIDHANVEYKAVQLSSQALQKYNNVGGSLSGGVNKQYPHGSLNVKLKGGYRINLNKEIKLAADAAPSANETLVKSNYEYLTSDRGELSFNIRYDFDTGKEYNLYVKTMPSAIIYPGEKYTYGFQLAVGLTL